MYGPHLFVTVLHTLLARLFSFFVTIYFRVAHYYPTLNNVTLGLCGCSPPRVCFCVHSRFYFDILQNCWLSFLHETLAWNTASRRKVVLRGSETARDAKEIELLCWEINFHLSCDRGNALSSAFCWLIECWWFQRVVDFVTELWNFVPILLRFGEKFRFVWLYS